MSRGGARVFSLVFWAIGFPLFHAGLPWAISLLTPRYGWTDGAPGRLNQLGFVPLGFGILLILWVLALHFSKTPERVELEATPVYLLTSGPYAFSRNPLYLAEIVLWTGWAMYYGSLALLLALALFWGMLNFKAVPYEEKNLEARFGESFRQYKNRVPRWLGRVRP